MNQALPIDQTDSTDSSAAAIAAQAPVIVGAGCRLPGARGPDAMWRVLIDGRCTVGTVDPTLFDPALYHDPRPNQRGKAYSMAAGQIEGLYAFDAQFFGISPREAEQMDPQQRLMLQTTWEAVEDAGLNIQSLAGDRTGVFVGASTVDSLASYYYDPARGGSAFSLGHALNIIANRVSATFDFGGPSYVLDAACSSGLFALHQAAEALRRDELDTAIVGAVHMVRAPGGFVGFSQARMLSPTGLCRAFDAGADGYVRSEACVVLVLQRPHVAQRMQARRFVRVLATGVNTDGGASRLTVPSAPRQERLIETVLERSGRDPEDFAFFEAHGTGTQVGDPVEARSIGRGLAQLRRAPLLIGSAKTNFGHAEPAAGLVGVLKAVLALENRVIPPSLHFCTPNPQIDFDSLNLRVASTRTPLAQTGSLVAGINSFGFGGTNVTVVIERGEDQPITSPKARPVEIAPPTWLLISAASETALRSLAGAWAERVKHSTHEERTALAAAACACRAPLPHRLALPLDADAHAGLQRFSDGAMPSGTMVQGVARLTQPRTVFAFPGNGAQYAGMGQAAYARDPVYRRSFDDIAQAFETEGISDLVRLLHHPDLAKKLRDPAVAQPLLFACQIAQTKSLAAEGLIPSAVIGHSVGEIAALYVAGAFDLAGAARIIASRSRAFQTLRGTGTMAVVAVSEADITRALAGLWEQGLEIAAVNSPRSVTVTGSATAIDRLARVSIGGKRLAMVRLDVEVPYHSAAIDPLQDQFMRDLDGVAFSPCTLPVAAAAIGRMLRRTEGDAAYLWRNARNTVRFADALAALAQEGPCQIVEISPKSTLSNTIRDMVRFSGLSLDYFAPGQTASDSARSVPDLPVAARAWVQGLAVSTVLLAGRHTGPAPLLPAYPWQEQNYRGPLSEDGLDAWGEAGQRQLVGHRPERASPVWIADFSPVHPEWIADHKIAGRVVVPAAALIEMVLNAGAQIWPETPLELRDLDILAPAVVEDEGLRIRTVLDPDTGAVTLSQRARLSRSEWSVFLRATLRKGGAIPKVTRQRRPRAMAQAAPLYTFLKDRGIDYGGCFQRLASLHRQGRMTLVADLAPPSHGAAFLLDPTALDAGFHALSALLMPLAGTNAPGQSSTTHVAKRLSKGHMFLPTHLDSLHLQQAGGVPVRLRIDLKSLTIRNAVLDLLLYDARGTCVARATGVTLTLARIHHALPIARDRTALRKVRLRLPDTPVRRPEAWHRPQRILRRMGLTQTSTPAPTTEAFSDLRTALALDDGSLPTALANALRLAPELAEDLHALLASQGGRAHAVGLHSNTQRRLWHLAERLVNQLAQDWRKGERLNILVLGMPDISVLNRWTVESAIDHLAVAAGDGTDLVQQILPKSLHPLIAEQPVAGMFDLVLAIGAAAANEQIPQALAEGGLALRLDTVDLTAAATVEHSDWQTWYDGGLRLRWRVADMGTRPAQPQIAAIRPADLTSDLPRSAQGLAGLIDAGSDVDSPQILLHVHRTGDDVQKTLIAQLMRLKHHMHEESVPLVLVCLNAGDAPGFAMVSAGLSAALRTMTNEFPDRRIALITVDAMPDAACPLPWSRLLTLSADEPVLHVDATGIYGERVCKLPAARTSAKVLCLSVENPGRLESLTWKQKTRPRLRQGDVEIAVAATGLNFRDVMWARGLLPERALLGGASGAGIGMECAGVVVRTGPEPTLAVGTRVMGFAPDAFATLVTVPQTAVVPVPDGLSLHDAAGVPVVFTTAWEGLVRLARVQPGETVLIHGGAGGVGLAAIQIALSQGARVFATAGTREKRALVKAMGAEAVFDSRSADFAQAVRVATQGRGVDVVLNSLSGAAMQHSVACLAPFGRFVELGKRDFLEGTRLDLRPFAANLSYFAYDLDQRLAHDPDGIATTMSSINTAFAQGHLSRLPVTTFSADLAEEAFRHMLASRHIGKIVITPPKPSARSKKASPLREDWVILGGTGGVGLCLAKALLGQGARHVHLVSRSGRIDLGARTEGGWIDGDAKVTLHNLDASDPSALGAFFGQLSLDGRHVGGVVHAAMTVRDRMVKDLDLVEIEMVMSSKLGVAVALDQVLRATPEQPEHVVFLSSLAAQVGNPGQAAYASASAAMEALAALRRQDGLNAMTIGWGAISDSGYLLRHKAVSRQLSRINGIELLSVEEIIKELFSAINVDGPTDYCFAAVDWVQLSSALPSLTGPLFSRLVPPHAARDTPAADFVETLVALDWPTALHRVTEALASIVAGIMRLPAEQFDPQRPFGQYGLDSLMAMELRLELEQRFGNRLSTLVMTHTMTTAQLAVTLLSRIKGATDSSPALSPAALRL